jgi:hypothetical protein
LRGMWTKGKDGAAWGLGSGKRGARLSTSVLRAPRANGLRSRLLGWMKSCVGDLGEEREEVYLFISMPFSMCTKRQQVERLDGRGGVCENPRRTAVSALPLTGRMHHCGWERMGGAMGVFCIYVRLSLAEDRLSCVEVAEGYS